MRGVTKVSRYITGALVAFLFLTGSVTITSAQNAVPPKVAAFLGDPDQLLKDFPNGGPLMANEVQQLALTDQSTFNVLLSLVAKANDAQKGGIGEGLAQAAKIEVLTNQALAEEWQQQIAASDDPTFKAAATNAFGDVQIGAVNSSPLGGLGGGPSGPSGPISAGPAEDIRSTPIVTSKFTITSTTTSGPSLTLSTVTTIGPGPTSSVSP